MNALGLSLLVLLAQTPAPAGPAKFDVTSMLPNMAVLTDGNQHYLVYVITDHPVPEPLFYGDGKSFYRLEKSGGGASGTETWSVVFNDPRSPIHRPSLTMRDSGKSYEVECKTKRTFTPVSPQPAAKMVNEASFFEPRWQRRPISLLRDETGVYYFVDQLRTKTPERRDVRVFVGPRGKMVSQPLKDVADDSAGLVLTTKNGELRLVVNAQPVEGEPAPKPDPSKWVKGGKTTTLVRLDLDDPRNATLVMNDLGVYDGVPIGTPCDDLP